VTGSRGKAPHVLVNSVGPWPVPGDLVERGLKESLQAEGVHAGEVSVTFLDDQGIEALNRDYFGKERPTDVIAFALHEAGEPLLGDIYVGYEQARRQAEELSVPLEEELLRLAIHGALHLLGHDHPQGEEREGSEMFRRQEELLRRVLGREVSP
jgi:probable rRNA maturation factor